jgi:hypothetical protein
MVRVSICPSLPVQMTEMQMRLIHGSKVAWEEGATCGLKGSADQFPLTFK